MRWSAPRAFARASFIVGRTGEDDGGPVGLGDAQGEKGDAAGAEDEDGFSGVELALFNEGVPGGERGAGQGGGLLEAERVGECG